MTGSMKSAVVDKLLKIREYLDELKGAKPASFDAYCYNKIKRYGIERLIQLIVDLALDINNILIKANNRPPANDYYSSFIELVELGILDEKFAYKIAPSTGLRNRLVHEYEETDDQIVYQSIDKTYKFYMIYVKNINEYIK